MLDILVIGKGWSGDYICNYAIQANKTVAATTRDGRNGTIPFQFLDSSTLSDFEKLPSATSICVTFPLSNKSQAAQFIDLYRQTHSQLLPNLILLGSTRPWVSPPPLKFPWMDRNDPIDENADPLRVRAEQEWLNRQGCVLNLAGLWGGERHPRKWISRIAPTKEALKVKDSLHLVHGVDVARAVLALASDFTPGEKWILTDQHVYDWYDLVAAYGNDMQKAWIQELIQEQGLPALPRPATCFQRALNSNQFWNRFGLFPQVSLWTDIK